MDDDQFGQMMDAIETGNDHLRSIRGWVSMLGVLVLLGLALTLIGAFATVYNA